ncbi:unnamed protein product, partial [Tenebrio molitor]
FIVLVEKVVFAVTNLQSGVLVIPFTVSSLFLTSYHIVLLCISCCVI